MSTPKGWSDTEKLGIFFQIMSKMEKPIPWSELEIPEGRTLKAVQVMVDKEKSKVRKAQAAANGEDGSETPATPTPATPASKGKKRGAKDAGDESTKKTKKPRSASKKKVTAGADEDDEEKAPSEAKEETSDGASDGEAIKPEPTEEDNGELI